MARLGDGGVVLLRRPLRLWVRPTRVGVALALVPALARRGLLMTIRLVLNGHRDEVGRSSRVDLLLVHPRVVRILRGHVRHALLRNRLVVRGLVLLGRRVVNLRHVRLSLVHHRVVADALLRWRRRLMRHHRRLVLRRHDATGAVGLVRVRAARVVMNLQSPMPTQIQRELFLVSVSVMSFATAVGSHLLRGVALTRVARRSRVSARRLCLQVTVINMRLATGTSCQRTADAADNVRSGVVTFSASRSPPQHNDNYKPVDLSGRGTSCDSHSRRVCFLRSDRRRPCPEQTAQS